MMSSCNQSMYLPLPSDTQVPGVSSESLALGRNLYVNSCGSCHSLYQPGKFSDSEWTKVMPEMQKKARCSDQETVLILNYLKGFSKKE